MYAPRSQKCVQRRRVRLGRTVGAMDGAIEPHGWVYGVSCPAAPSASQRIRKALLWLWLWLWLRKAGRRAAGPPATPSPGDDVLLQLIQLAPLRIDHRFHQVADGDHPSTCAPSTTGRWRMR